jgi:hypothetical protein
MKPILKLYRGYANEQELIVMGHVFNPLQLKNIIFRKESKKCDLNDNVSNKNTGKCRCIWITIMLKFTLNA